MVSYLPQAIIKCIKSNYKSIHSITKPLTWKERKKQHFNYVFHKTMPNYYKPRANMRA